MFKSVVLLCAILASPALVAAAGGFTCKQPANQPGSMARLAYCVYDPVSNAPVGGWPTIISLPGSGARGPPSNAKNLSGFDAVGKLIAQYLSGQKDDARTMAATKFLTIVPIAPEGSRHFDPENVLAILNEVKANYKVDADRVYVTGFSMGSRGSWRFATAHPEVLAAVAPSAGGAERQGDGTLSQEAAPATFPLLNKIVGLPIRQFAGASDTTAGTEAPKATEAQLQSDGAVNAKLEILGTDHMGLSTKPWTDTDLLSWFLKQSRSGTTSSSASSSAKPSPVKSNGKKPGMVKIVRPAATETGSDEEDCEEDNSVDEEDCEEDAPAAVDEEDCEDDSTPAAPSTEEDCEEDSPASNNSRRSVLPRAHRHQSVKISHKRRAIRFGKKLHYKR